ncbi:MAG: PAS domain S-box protein [Bacteroidales bacterium]|nr:PAS domain S-box protein [Bacteroidales bacterium]
MNYNKGDKDKPTRDKGLINYKYKNSIEPQPFINNTPTLLLDQLNIGMYRKTMEEIPRIIDVTEPLVKMFGYADKAEMMKVPVQDFYAEPKVMETFVQNLYQKGYTKKQEILLKKKNGKTFPALVSAYIVKDQNNEDKYIDGIVEDITEKKNIYKALEEREALYKDLYDNVPDMFFSVKPDGQIISVNKTGAETLGYKKSELIGKPVWIVVYPEDLPSVKNKIKQILKKKQIFGELQFRKITKDGQVVWVNERTQLLFDDKNNVKELRIICRDVSQRLKMEEALKFEEERFRSITNNLNVGIYRSTADEKGKFIEINSAFRKIFGYHDKEELFSIRVSDLYVHKQDRKKLFKDIQDQGFIKNREVVLKKKSGETFIASLSSVIINDNNGKPLYYDGIVEDITELKNIQNKIRESEYKYRTLIEALPDIVYITDYNRNLLFANPALKYQTGYAVKDFRESLNDKSYIHPEDTQFISAIINGFIESNKKYSEVYENRIIDKSGKVHTYSTVISKTIFEGKKALQFISRDITKQKQTLDDLNKRDEQYKTLFNFSPSGILIEDEKGVIIDVNPAFCHMMGYTRSELVGQKVHLLAHPDAVENVDKNIKTLLSGKNLKHVEKSIKKDGSISFMELNERMMRLPDGRKGVVCMVEDITQRKLAEETIKNSEESYRGLFDSTTDAIYIQDKEGIFMDVNKGAEKMYGYPREYFLGKTPDFLSAPGKNDNKKTARFIENAFKGKPQRFEFWGMDSKGRTFPKEVSLNRGRYFGKEVVIAFAQDITERQKAEEEIRKLSRSVEQTPAMVIITDLDGKIEYVNPKFTETTGYSLSEIKGRNPKILKSGSTPLETYNNLWKTIKAGKDWSGQFLNRKKNGELYWESANIFPLKDEKGVITHFIGMKEDITERKRMEEDLITAKEKAEESDKLKSAFLANMSHEIRTPMNSIIGFSQLLSEPGLDEEEKTQYIELIQNSGNDLLNLIDDIIDISKIEAGQMKVFKSQYFLDSVMKEMYISFSELIKTKEDKLQITLRYSPPEDAEKVILYSDIDRFKQIIRNLLNNALKFTDFGLVDFGFKVVNKSKEPHIEFFVRDTGIGIPKDKTSIIFESFRQANFSDTKIYGGTGLGLTITKKMVEILGGEIWVKSTEGQGSTFYFTLPYIPGKTAVHSKQMTEKPQSPQFNWKDKKILIVEDNDLSYLYFSRILAKTGAKITRAKDGREGLNYFKADDFNLVLMDIQLPEMDGYTTTKEIKKISPDIPVIAQTAFAMVGEKERCLQVGCDAYISKPIKINDFFEVVGKFIK